MDKSLLPYLLVRLPLSDFVGDFEMAETLKTSTLRLTSTAFAHEGMIPEKYTCDGQNINPHLCISGVPENTKSLALLMDDPDAPQGTFTHWILWGIDPDIQEIAEYSIPPKSNQGTNSFGDLGYDGPCPPGGTHRYQFHLYALDTKIGLHTGANRQDFEQAIEGHILSQTTLIGKYSR